MVFLFVVVSGIGLRSFGSKSCQVRDWTSQQDAGLHLRVVLAEGAGTEELWPGLAGFA